jgi:hypothetical protein
MSVDSIAVPPLISAGVRTVVITLEFSREIHRSSPGAG